MEPIHHDGAEMEPFKTIVAKVGKAIP